MSKFQWKEKRVISIQLKDNSFILGQLLKSPFIAFFPLISSEMGDWGSDVLEGQSPTFIAAVTSQFKKHSIIKVLPKIKPSELVKFPLVWIKSGATFRDKTVKIDEERIIEFGTIGAANENQLVELDEHTGVEKVIQNSIDPIDKKTISENEIFLINTFLNLNERLFLCKEMKQNVDVDKDILFDRPVKNEYWNYIRILASDGSLDDWGY